MSPFIELYKERLNLKNALFLLIEHDDALVAVVYKVLESNESFYSRVREDLYCENIV